ncbi:MAG: response regulator [Nitrospirota bacterium]|nr:response regulator [Nitrospirota bacterium]
MDDDTACRELLFAFLVRAGYPVDQACNGVDALTQLEAREYGLVITDYSMPGMNGLHLLSILKRRWPDTRVIFLSADRSGVMSQALQEGALACFSKPFDCARLLETVAHVMRTGFACGESSAPLAKDPW